MSLAQMVYSPEEYGNLDEKGVEISNTDSVRMQEIFLMSSFWLFM